jgi:kelch-like protein 19
MNRARLHSFLSIFFLVGLLSGCQKSAQKRWVEEWQETSPLIEARSGAGIAASGNRLYIAGGVSIEKGFLRSVEWTVREPDGRLEPWRPASPLSIPRGFLALAASDDYLYAIGGANDRNGRNLLNSVERARILENGSLSPWTPVSPMTTPRRGPAALISRGYIYAVGGYNGIFLRSLERARLTSNGGLEKWETVGPLLTTDRYIHGAALIGDHLYVIGGHVRDQGGGKGSTEWTRIGEDGAIERWRSASPLLFPRFLAAVTAAGNRLFVLGGYDGNYMSSVERAEIRSDGSLGPWSAATPLTAPREGSAAISLEGTIYLMGGSREGVYLRDVEMAWVNENGEPGHWAPP